MAENRRPLVVLDTRTDERFRWVKGLDQERFANACCRSKSWRRPAGQE